MDRKLLTFFVGLAVTITLRAIPITAQPNGAQQSVETVLRQQEEASQRQRAADNIAAIASILSRIDLRQTIEDQRRTDDEPKNFAQYVWKGLQSQTGSNYVLAMLAGAAALIGVFTLKAIHRQADEMVKQWKLAKATLKNTQRTDRAWVSLESLEIIRGREVSDRTVIIEFKNSGRTPATIIEANISFAGLKNSADDDFEATGLPPTPEYRDGKFAYPTFLVAGEMSRWDYRVESTHPENYSVLMAKPGESRSFWIYGRIHYTEPSEPSKVRKYGWVREYDQVLSAQADPKVFKFRYVQNPSYNYAD